MTEPGTTAAKAHGVAETGHIILDPEVYAALCDGYDEAQRLRYVEADLANAREAGAAYKRQRDAARQALADLIGELRGMCDRADRLDPFDQDAYNLGTNDIRAVIDRHDPETP